MPPTCQYIGPEVLGQCHVLACRIRGKALHINDHITMVRNLVVFQPALNEDGSLLGCHCRTVRQWRPLRRKDLILPTFRRRPLYRQSDIIFSACYKGAIDAVVAPREVISSYRLEFTRRAAGRSRADPMITRLSRSWAGRGCGGCFTQGL